MIKEDHKSFEAGGQEFTCKKKSQICIRVLYSNLEDKEIETGIKGKTILNLEWHTLPRLLKLILPKIGRRVE